MGLEAIYPPNTAYIDDLDEGNPVGSTDPVSQLDSHVQGIKNVLLLSFPNITGPMTCTQAELNRLDGVTPGTATANKALVVGAGLDLNQVALGRVIDSVGTSVLVFNEVASANVWLSVFNTLDANAQIRAEGAADYGITYLDSNDNTLAIMRAVASADGFLRLSNGSTELSIDAIGIQTDIDINLTPKGAGKLITDLGADSVDTDAIVDQSVTTAKLGLLSVTQNRIASGAVRFSNEIESSGVDVTIMTVSTAADKTVVLPPGVWNIGEITAITFGFSGNLYVEVYAGAAWQELASESVGATGNINLGQVISDGTNVRVRFDYTSGSAGLTLTGRRIYK